MGFKSKIDRKAGDEHMGMWVYCGQHLGPHRTGWCSVSITDKVGLFVNTEEEAIEKCRRLGLRLYRFNDAF